ncbi:hypothetical protein, partial [Bacillus cereus group sp. BfR-BA-01395]
MSIKKSIIISATILFTCLPFFEKNTFADTIQPKTATEPYFNTDIQPGVLAPATEPYFNTDIQPGVLAPATEPYFNTDIQPGVLAPAT